MRTAAMTPEERFNSSVEDELWACGVCATMWPARQMKFQDGIESDRRCPNHFAPQGGELARTLREAAASEKASVMTSQYAAPPKFPGWLDGTPPAGLVEFRYRPLLLVRGGASAVLTIDGTNLATTDTITYVHAGITNAIAPALTPVTYDSDGNALTPFVDVLVLTVQASVAVPLGFHSLTYNDNEYGNVFDVR